MDVNFLSAARQASKIAQRSTKIDQFLRGEFKAPSLFTQKGLEKAVMAQSNLKGGLVHSEEVYKNIKFMLDSNRESYVNSHIAELQAKSDSKEVSNQILRMKPEYTEFIDTLYAQANVTMRSLFPTEAQAKANKVIKEIVE